MSQKNTTEQKLAVFFRFFFSIFFQFFYFFYFFFSTRSLTSHYYFKNKRRPRRCPTSSCRCSNTTRTDARRLPRPCDTLGSRARPPPATAGAARQGRRRQRQQEKELQRPRRLGGPATVAAAAAAAARRSGATKEKVGRARARPRGPGRRLRLLRRSSSAAPAQKTSRPSARNERIQEKENKIEKRNDDFFSVFVSGSVF